MALLHPRAVLAVLGAFFVALTGAVALIGVLPADAALREALLGYATPSLVEAMRIVNYGGDWRFLLPASLLLFALLPRARERWWVWIALMLAAPSAEGLLKIVIGRPRPEDAASGFPSGHAAAAAAFFGAVLYLAGALPPTLRRRRRDDPRGPRPRDPARPLALGCPRRPHPRPRPRRDRRPPGLPRPQDRSPAH
jgi:membrane-associated phospholipid phosphatase